MRHLHLAHRRSRENVAATALVLNVRRVRLSFNHLIDFETRRHKVRLHLAWLEEDKVERDLPLPPFLEMNNLITDMEGEKQRRSRFESSRELSECFDDLVARNVDD